MSEYVYAAKCNLYQIGDHAIELPEREPAKVSPERRP